MDRARRQPPTLPRIDAQTLTGCITERVRTRRSLARAIEDGVAYPFQEILTDVDGQTYVGAGHNVLARCMNADLTRLGY